MDKYEETPPIAHTYARTQSSEQLCCIISWRPSVSSDVSGLQRHSREEINIMIKSRFHACSGETLTSTIYYSFILKQSRKRIPALLTQHMTAKTRRFLFDSLNIENMISFRLFPRWTFFSVKLIKISMDHVLTKSIFHFFLKACILTKYCILIQLHKQVGSDISV